MINGAALSILIFLLGTLVTLDIRRKNACDAAAAKFRLDLLNALTGLYPVPTDWPKDVDAHLRKIFPSLQRSVAEFRPYLPWYKRRAYDKAWFVYRLGVDGREIDKQIYHQYMEFSSPDKRFVDPKKQFHANVSKLFRFAGRT
jgi:hypothetical protein